MTQQIPKEWSSVLLSDILKEHPRAIHLFDSFKNIQCSDTSLTVIDFCQKYQVPIEEMEGILRELDNDSYVLSIGANEWELDFLVDFLINIHHNYLRKRIPLYLKNIEEILLELKDPSIQVIRQILLRAEKDLLKSIQQTENAIFPYIKQIARAYKSKESYGELLVSTLRKPIAQQLNIDIEMMKEILEGIRTQSNYYCQGIHSYAWRRLMVYLKDLDIQLQRHIQLKEEVLLPKSLQVEAALNKI